MSEVTDLVTPMLQQIQTHLTRMEERIDLLVGDTRDVKVRMTHAGEGLAGVIRRLGRVERRVERIERRLDLVEA